MTATPDQHAHDSWTLPAIHAWVIQSHVDRHVPALTHHRRSHHSHRRTRVMAWGFWRCLPVSVLIWPAPSSLTIGLPWCCLEWVGISFRGRTVLLTQSYYPPERFKAQGFNDFTVFGVQALASLSAGALVFSTSWGVINLIALPLLLMVLVAVYLVSRQPAPQPAQDTHTAIQTASSQD